MLVLSTIHFHFIFPMRSTVRTVPPCLHMRFTCVHRKLTAFPVASHFHFVKRGAEFRAGSDVKCLGWVYDIRHSVL